MEAPKMFKFIFDMSVMAQMEHHRFMRVVGTIY